MTDKTTRDSLAHFEAFLWEQISTEDLARYLTAESGWRLGVYDDGSVHVGPGIGDEIDPDERPLASVTCRGIGALDPSWWMEIEDSDEDEEPDDDPVGALTASVFLACEEGDVSPEMQDLIEALMCSWQEHCRMEESRS